MQSLISEEEFKEWTENPVTVAVFKYLTDWQLSYAKAMVNGVMDGVIYSREDQLEAGAKREVILDLTTLQFSEIEEFYKEE